MNYEKCAYPDCEGNYVPARTGTSKLCTKHFEMLGFIIWALNNVKFKGVDSEAVTESGLVIPKGAKVD